MSAKFNRRTILAAFAALVPARVAAAAPVQSESLAQFLRSDVMQTGARHFQLLSYTETQDASALRARAEVVMHWAPGQRRRAFDVTATNADQALADLKQSIRAEFSV